VVRDQWFPVESECCFSKIGTRSAFGLTKSMSPVDSANELLSKMALCQFSPNQ